MEIINQLGIDLHLLLGQIIAFLIFAAIFWRLFQKPLLNILDERRAEIRDTYDQLDKDRAEMARIRQEYEERLAGIEAEARNRIQEAIKEAQVLRDGLIADARKQAETIVQRGRTETERERQKAFLEMRQQVATLAVLAAGKVIGESLDAQRHSKLVDDFISTVGLNSIEHRTDSRGSTGLSA
jgi:F-type H+-transporting ATPase subunit b